MYKNAFIINVGTTLDPILHEINDIYNKYGKNISVILTYGRPFPDQYPNPLKVANDAEYYARKKGLNVESIEISDPENLDYCIQEYDKLVQKLIKQGFSSLIVDFTGGTKVMSAALVHCVLLSPFEKVEFRYVGGKIRDKNGKVIRDAMSIIGHVDTMIRERVNLAIKAAKSHDYYRALTILDYENITGKPLFVKKAIHMLYLWDNFDYENVEKIYGNMNEIAQLFEDDPHLENLCQTIKNLSKLSKRLARVTSLLIQIENRSIDIDQLKDIEGHFIISLDTLENAKRRIIEGRYVDAVLRSYRAVEVAMQVISIGKLCLNPWNPDWTSLEKEKILKEFNKNSIEELPDSLALFDILKVLKAVKEIDLISKVIRIATMRNHSYLEHGYQKIKEKSAKTAVKTAEEILDTSAKMLDIPEERIKKYKEMLIHKI